MTEAQIEAKKMAHGLITVANSLKQVCDDLDFIAKDSVLPAKKLLNAANDTVLMASCNLQETAINLVQLQAANEALQQYYNMCADFICSKGLLNEYVKFTERYE